jgi:hypothetical protein
MITLKSLEKEEIEKIGFYADKAKIPKERVINWIEYNVITMDELEAGILGTSTYLDIGGTKYVSVQHWLSFPCISMPITDQNSKN